MAISLGLGLDVPRLRYGTGGGFRPASLLGYAAHYRSDRVTAEPLFADDFSDGDASDWTLSAGTVTVDAGQLQLNTDNMFVTQNLGVANGVWEWDETYEGDVGGFVFRYAGSADTLRIYYTATYVRAEQLNSGTTTSTNFVTSTIGVTYHYKSVLFGDTWRVYRDDVLLHDITIDSAKYAAMAGTSFGPRTSVAGNNRWDNITVRTVDPATDLQWAADTFPQADTALSGETTEVGGYTWTSSTMTIVSNAVQPISDATASVGYVASGQPDIDITATFNTGAMSAAGDHAGVSYRHTSATSCWNAYYTGDANVILQKYDTTPTSVATTAVTALGASTSHTLRVVVVGNIHRVLLDGVLIHEYTDALNNTVENHGVYSKSTTAADDAQITAITVSAPPLVPCWPDISGEGNHAVQADLTKAPMLLPKVTDGGQAGVVFPARSTSTMVAAGVTLTQPYTAAVSGRSTESGATRYLFDGASAGTRSIVYRSAPNWYAYAAAAMTLGTSTDATVRIAAMFDGTSSAGAQDGTASYTGNTGTHDPAGITLGSNYLDTSNYLIGEISELVFWDADHTDRLAEIDNYLNAWG